MIREPMYDEESLAAIEQQETDGAGITGHEERQRLFPLPILRRTFTIRSQVKGRIRR